MSVTDVLLILVIIALVYLSITLKLIGAAVERIASTSHYPQEAPFRPSIRAQKASQAPETLKATRTVQDNNLVDITDLPEDKALAVLEGMGIN